MQTTNFESYLKARQYSPSTIDTLQREIKTYLQWLKQQQIEPEQASYQDQLSYMKHCSRKGFTQKTIQHHINTLKHYYQHLIETNQIKNNPTDGIEVKGVKRKHLHPILDPNQLHNLYNQYPSETLTEKRNKTMLGLLLYQGLRSAELNPLTLSSIDYKAGTITIQSGKKNNGRTLNLEPHQIMELYEYQHQVRNQLLPVNIREETQTLYISLGGKEGQCVQQVTSMMMKIRTRHPEVQSTHQIRASVITKWIKRYNLREAQYYAGHRYISSTEAYLSNAIDDLQEEIQQYHPLG